MNGEKPVYDPDKLKGAAIRALCRAAAAGFMLYLSWQILGDTRSGASDVPPLVSWLAIILFTAAAIGFGIYTVLSFRADMAGAVMSEEETMGDEPGAGETGEEFDSVSEAEEEDSDMESETGEDDTDM